MAKRVVARTTLHETSSSNTFATAPHSEDACSVGFASILIPRTRQMADGRGRRQERRQKTGAEGIPVKEPNPRTQACIGVLISSLLQNDKAYARAVYRPMVYVHGTPASVGPPVTKPANLEWLPGRRLPSRRHATEVAEQLHGVLLDARIAVLADVLCGACTSRIDLPERGETNLQVRLRRFSLSVQSILCEPTYWRSDY